MCRPTEREKDASIESFGYDRGTSVNASFNNGVIHADDSVGSITIDRDKKGQADFKFSGVVGPDATQHDLFPSLQPCR